MMNSLALSGWRQLRAVLPGHRDTSDTESAGPTFVGAEDRELVERQRVALATLSLGWGSCFPTAERFYSWEGPKDPRLN